MWKPHIRKLAQGLDKGSGRGGHRSAGPVLLPWEQTSYWGNSWATKGNPAVCMRLSGIETYTQMYTLLELEGASLD